MHEWEGKRSCGPTTVRTEANVERLCVSVTKTVPTPPVSLARDVLLFPKMIREKHTDVT